MLRRQVALQSIIVRGISPSEGGREGALRRGKTLLGRRDDDDDDEEEDGGGGSKQTKNWRSSCWMEWWRDCMIWEGV